MINVTLTKDIVYSDKSSIPVVVEPCLVGCTVRYLDQEHRVVWEDIPDMEKLAEKFQDNTVRVFKVIVELLGQAYRMKDMFE